MLRQAQHKYARFVLYLIKPDTLLGTAQILLSEYPGQFVTHPLAGAYDKMDIVRTADAVNDTPEGKTNHIGKVSATPEGRGNGFWLSIMKIHRVLEAN